MVALPLFSLPRRCLLLPVPDAGVVPAGLRSPCHPCNLTSPLCAEAPCVGPAPREGTVSAAHSPRDGTNILDREPHWHCLTCRGAPQMIGCPDRGNSGRTSTATLPTPPKPCFHAWHWALCNTALALLSCSKAEGCLCPLPQYTGHRAHPAPQI